MTPRLQRRILRGTSGIAISMAILLLQGCATGPDANPRDPMEPLNRAVFRFNDTLDGAVLKPVATGYKAVTPSWIRKGVGNFFNNLQDMWSTVNAALQGRGPDFSDNAGRVMVNTTMGLFGLIDVASSLQIDRHTTDFGTTLGRWGVPPGPYVVLPVLGPFTLREVAGYPIDYTGDPSSQLGGTADAAAETTVLKIVDRRAKLLDAGNIIDGASLDPYSFMRDSYLQRQRNIQYDGNPPDEDLQP
jgi:phospholipid-binding lipoprotein MlaA